MLLTSFETRRVMGHSLIRRMMGIAEAARDDVDINSAGYSTEFVRSFFAATIYLAAIQFLLHKYLCRN